MDSYFCPLDGPAARDDCPAPIFYNGKVPVGLASECSGLGGLNPSGIVDLEPDESNGDAFLLEDCVLKGTQITFVTRGLRPFNVTIVNSVLTDSCLTVLAIDGSLPASNQSTNPLAATDIADGSSLTLISSNVSCDIAPSVLYAAAFGAVDNTPSDLSVNDTALSLAILSRAPLRV